MGFGHGAERARHIIANQQGAVAFRIRGVGATGQSAAASRNKDEALGKLAKDLLHMDRVHHACERQVVRNTHFLHLVVPVPLTVPRRLLHLRVLARIHPALCVFRRIRCFSSRCFSSSVQVLSLSSARRLLRAHRARRPRGGLRRVRIEQEAVHHR